MIEFKFDKIEEDHYKYNIYSGDKLISKEELLLNKDKWEEIAEKNALNGVAFIQALAMCGDVDAAFLQCIYQTYRKFLENSETNQFQTLSEIVLKRAKAYSLKYHLATYIQSLIEEEPSNDKKVIEAKIQLHKIIPGFEKAFTADIYRLHPERLISVPEMQKTHNAFPDFIKFENSYYLAFREADHHVKYKDLGSIRILKGSYDEKRKSWQFQNQQVLSEKTYDLRDPRFFVNGENKLMLIIGGSKINKKSETSLMVPHVASLEGNIWKMQPAIVEGTEKGKKGQWIWRVTWNYHDNKGYALSYGISDQLDLLQTADGIHYKKIKELSTDKTDQPFNEATIRFKEDGTMVALIRAQKQGVIATSKMESGYKEWQFNPLHLRLGGPNFLIREDGEMIAGIRYFFLNQDNSLDMGTVVAYMDEKHVFPLLRLKSRLDNSYPGMMLEDDNEISFLHYTTGEEDGACDLYLTRIKYKPFF